MVVAMAAAVAMAAVGSTRAAGDSTRAAVGSTRPAATTRLLGLAGRLWISGLWILGRLWKPGLRRLGLWRPGLWRLGLGPRFRPGNGHGVGHGLWPLFVALRAHAL